MFFIGGVLRDIIYCMEYLAVLGRQPEISVAELEALFSDVRKISEKLATFKMMDSDKNCVEETDLISRLGGSLKLAKKLDLKPIEFLANLPEGKITIGVSDYSKGASKKSASSEALKLKKILVRHGRSVRVVENREAVLSTATSLHNGLSGKNERKVELIKVNEDWYKVIGVQNIDAYAERDRVRPARDSKVGMLPPKLAQVLINLCGPLDSNSRILDPFCGTGVVLQEALLMGYRAYGTDISEKMVEYSEKNIEWLAKSRRNSSESVFAVVEPTTAERVPRKDGRTSGLEEGLGRDFKTRFKIQQGDATSFQWEKPIDAVACEGYLGKPFLKIPTEMEFKEQKQECQAIILGFLKNLSKQIKTGVPVIIAAPSWLRENGEYLRLEILDEIQKLGYNVNNKTCEGLLYHREKQIVARDILILRKK